MRRVHSIDSRLLLRLNAAMLAPLTAWLVLVICWPLAGYLFRSYAKRPQVVRMGAALPIQEIDVFCNGVHLGRTPLDITRDILSEAIPEWTTPPRQARMDNYPGGRPPFLPVECTRAPYDLFAPYSTWPDWFDFSDWEKSEVDGVFAEARHWWHFEKAGHVGLAEVSHPRNFDDWSRGESVLLCEPHIRFPAVDAHLDRMVLGLQRTRFRPSKEWLAHFARHLDLLFGGFYERAARDVLLKPALEQVVRAEFGLSAYPTADECDRVLGEIMARAEARGVFGVPSVESVAIELMGPNADAAIARRLEANERLLLTNSGDRSRELDGWRYWRRDDPAARMLPLEYAIRKHQPSDAFPAIVYACAAGAGYPYLNLVASYRTEEASDILLRIMNRAEHRPIWRQDFLAGHRIAGELLEVEPPAHDAEIRAFLSEIVQSDDYVTLSALEIRAFVEARTGHPEVDQSDLAEWVAGLRNVDYLGTIEMLAGIESPVTERCLGLYGSDVFWNRIGGGQLLLSLAERPNPSLDGILVDTWRWQERLPDAGSLPGQVSGADGKWSPLLSQALAVNDTAAIREFVRDRITSDPETAAVTLSRLAQAGGDYIGQMTWLLDTLAQVENPFVRAAASRLVAYMEAPEAAALLQRWAADPTEEVARAARQALEVRHELEREEALYLQQYEALISGEMAPDDLLPPAESWVWAGDEYVREATAKGAE